MYLDGLFIMIVLLGRNQFKWMNDRDREGCHVLDKSGLPDHQQVNVFTWSAAIHDSHIRQYESGAEA